MSVAAEQSGIVAFPRGAGGRGSHCCLPASRGFLNRECTFDKLSPATYGKEAA